MRTTGSAYRQGAQTLFQGLGMLDEGAQAVGEGIYHFSDEAKRRRAARLKLEEAGASTADTHAKEAAHDYGRKEKYDAEIDSDVSPQGGASSSPNEKPMRLPFGVNPDEASIPKVPDALKPTGSESDEDVTIPNPEGDGTAENPAHAAPDKPKEGFKPVAASSLYARMGPSVAAPTAKPSMIGEAPTAEPRLGIPGPRAPRPDLTESIGGPVGPLSGKQLGASPAGLSPALRDYFGYPEEPRLPEAAMGPGALPAPEPPPVPSPAAVSALMMAPRDATPPPPPPAPPAAMPAGGAPAFAPTTQEPAPMTGAGGVAREILGAGTDWRARAAGNIGLRTAMARLQRNPEQLRQITADQRSLEEAEDPAAVARDHIAIARAEANPEELKTLKPETRAGQEFLAQVLAEAGKETRHAGAATAAADAAARRKNREEFGTDEPPAGGRLGLAAKEKETARKQKLLEEFGTDDEEQIRKMGGRVGVRAKQIIDAIHERIKAKPGMTPEKVRSSKLAALKEVVRQAEKDYTQIKHRDDFGQLAEGVTEDDVESARTTQEAARKALNDFGMSGEEAGASEGPGAKYGLTDPANVENVNAALDAAEAAGDEAAFKAIQDAHRKAKGQ